MMLKYKNYLHRILKHKEFFFIIMLCVKIFTLPVRSITN